MIVGSQSASGRAGEALEHPTPSLRRIEGSSDGFGLIAEPAEVAMLSAALIQPNASASSGPVR